MVTLIRIGCLRGMALKGNLIRHQSLGVPHNKCALLSKLKFYVKDFLFFFFLLQFKIIEQRKKQRSGFSTTIDARCVARLHPGPLIMRNIGWREKRAILGALLPCLWQHGEDRND